MLESVRYARKQIQEIKKFQETMTEGTKEFMVKDNSGEAIDAIVKEAEAALVAYGFDKKYLLAALLAASAKAGNLLEVVKE